VYYASGASSPSHRTPAPRGWIDDVTSHTTHCWQEGGVPSKAVDTDADADADDDAASRPENQIYMHNKFVPDASRCLLIIVVSTGLAESCQRSSIFNMTSKNK